MCRNIKTLFNFDPPVTQEEIRAAALQFVRKISGLNKPSKANERSFLAAVDEIAVVSTRLLHSLETAAPPKNREEEAAKARARAAKKIWRLSGPSKSNVGTRRAIASAETMHVGWSWARRYTHDLLAENLATRDVRRATSNIKMVRASFGTGR